jgi:hypothetical protein
LLWTCCPLDGGKKVSRRAGLREEGDRVQSLGALQGRTIRVGADKDHFRAAQLLQDARALDAVAATSKTDIEHRDVRTNGTGLYDRLRDAPGAADQLITSQRHNVSQSEPVSMSSSTISTFADMGHSSGSCLKRQPVGRRRFKPGKRQKIGRVEAGSNCG